MTQPPLDNPSEHTQPGTPEATDPTSAPYQPPAGQQHPPAGPGYPQDQGPAYPPGQQYAGGPYPGQQFAPGQFAPGQPVYPGYSPPFNTYSIIAFVLAVAVFPPLGIFFGYKARTQIAETGERGGEFATVGIVVGWIFTAIMILFVLAFCGMMAITASASTY